MQRIFHLDAGRKFFGKSQILSILDAMSRMGFTALEYYFLDNQGFRFGLNDMVLTTEYGRYDLNCALGDGYSQDDKHPDGSGKYLTESDLEEILAKASELGIKIIPALETPGHMGAILQYFPQLRYPGSDSSIDLSNPEAVAFAYGLVEKYAQYFASKGCSDFNFCADEFANDLGSMGFDRIYEDGMMAQFVSFANSLAELLCNLGLTPMAFNDGFYYHDDTERYGKLDNRIQLCYWCQGWNTYFPAKVRTLENKGFRLINAHQFYYCGAGCNWEERIARQSDFNPYVFDGGQRVEDPEGVMLCVWCDKANADGQDDGEHVARMAALAMEKASAAWNTLK